MSVMQDLYESAINCEVASFFDTGWRVRLGDPRNGFLAEDIVERWEEVDDWLTKQSLCLYPESAFAALHRPPRPGVQLRLV